MKRLVLALGLLLCLAAPAHAAIACSTLTAGGLVSATSSYPTNPVTPTANALVLASVWHSHATTAGNTPTATGNGLTWVSVGTFTFLTTERFTLFRAMGASPTNTAITFDFAAQNQTQAGWLVSQCTGVDTTGTNGSGAVTHWANNTGTSATPSVTLAAFTSVNDGTYGALIINTNNAPTAGSGFTGLNNSNVVSGFRMEDEWKTANDTGVDWATTSAAYGAMALELVAPTASTVVSPRSTLGLPGPGQ